MTLHTKKKKRDGKDINISDENFLTIHVRLTTGNFAWLKYFPLVNIIVRQQGTIWMTMCYSSLDDHVCKTYRKLHEKWRSEYFHELVFIRLIFNSPHHNSHARGNTRQLKGSAHFILSTKVFLKFLQLQKNISCHILSSNLSGEHEWCKATNRVQSLRGKWTQILHNKQCITCITV